MSHFGADRDSGLGTDTVADTAHCWKGSGEEGLRAPKAPGGFRSALTNSVEPRSDVLAACVKRAIHTPNVIGPKAAIFRPDWLEQIDRQCLESISKNKENQEPSNVR